MPGSLDRRRFLKLVQQLGAGAAGALFGSALPGCDFPDDPTGQARDPEIEWLSPDADEAPTETALVRQGPPKKVAVVGAGLAGLSAAYELSRAGHQVALLEARTRPGGRVLTLREPFATGLYAEAGFARFPEHHTATLAYASIFGLSLVPFFPDALDFVDHMRGQNIVYGSSEDPQLSRYPVTLSAEESAGGWKGLEQRWTGELLERAGDPRSADWPPEPLARYDAMTLRDYARARGLSPDAHALLSLGDYDLDADISALWLLQKAALAQADAQLLRIAGGNDRLPAAFAAKLGDRIRYGAAVSRIEQHADGVRALYRRGESTETLEAEQLICTVPFPALRDVEVAPALSEPKRRAVDELAFSSLSRISLQLSDRPWRAAGRNGFAFTDHPCELWEASADRQSKRGILQCYLKGEASRQLTALPETERVALTLERAEAVFPGIRDKLETATTTCWDQDPWARGGSLQPSPGQMTALFPHAAGAEGRIHFAGEHTSPWNGWMEGSLESGRRAAREINDAPA